MKFLDLSGTRHLIQKLQDWVRDQIVTDLDIVYRRVDQVEGSIPHSTSELQNNSGFIDIGTTINLIYPIGSIITTTLTPDEWDPNQEYGQYIGASWVLYSVDRMLMGTDTKSMVKGGAKSVTLKTTNMPAHNHDFVNGKATSAGAHTHTVSGTAASAGAHTHTVTGDTETVGRGTAFSILPPYTTVFFWRRDT